jgi:hypothetical protein
MSNYSLSYLSQLLQSLSSLTLIQQNSQAQQLVKQCLECSEQLLNNEHDQVLSGLDVACSKNNSPAIECCNDVNCISESDLDFNCNSLDNNEIGMNCCNSTPILTCETADNLLADNFNANNLFNLQCCDDIHSAAPLSSSEPVLSSLEHDCVESDCNEAICFPCFPIANTLSGPNNSAPSIMNDCVECCEIDHSAADNAVSGDLQSLPDLISMPAANVDGNHSIFDSYGTDPSTAAAPFNKDSSKRPNNTEASFFSCHQCKLRKPANSFLHCSNSNPNCVKKYCSTCLRKHYNFLYDPNNFALNNRWICFACQDNCNCKACVKKKQLFIETTKNHAAATFSANNSAHISNGSVEAGRLPIKAASTLLQSSSRHHHHLHPSLHSFFPPSQLKVRGVHIHNNSNLHAHIHAYPNSADYGRNHSDSTRHGHCSSTAGNSACSSPSPSHPTTSCSRFSRKLHRHNPGNPYFLHNSAAPNHHHHLISLGTSYKQAANEVNELGDSDSAVTPSNFTENSRNNSRSSSISYSNSSLHSPTNEFAFNFSLNDTVDSFPSSASNSQNNYGHNASNFSGNSSVAAKYFGSCHQCKSSKPLSELIQCSSRRQINPLTSAKTRDCRKKYCAACLERWYNIDLKTLRNHHNNNNNSNNSSHNGGSSDSGATNNLWNCPHCQGICTCAACLRANKSKILLLNSSTNTSNSNSNSNSISISNLPSLPNQ